MNDDNVVNLDDYRPEPEVADLIAAMRALSRRMKLINAILHPRNNGGVSNE